MRAAGNRAGSPSSFGSRRVRNSRATPSNALAALRDHRPLILNNLARQGVRDYFEVNGAAVIGSRHDPRPIGSCGLRCGVRRGDVCLHHCGSAYERTQVLKCAGAVMPTKQPRTHGADDRLLCPECGGVMTVVEYDHADAFVWQTFECGTCLNRIERGVKKYGDPHRK